MFFGICLETKTQPRKRENCEKVIVGVRPGEKIHEELITTSDSFTTYETDKVFINLPDNDKLRLSKFKLKFKHFQKVPANFSYTSGNNDKFLNIRELKKLLIEQLN